MNRMPSPSPRVRPPVQQRSRDTLERTLQTGVELLGEGGWDAVTVTEISKRAKVSVGALYGRFEGKDALHLAIQARILETIEADQDRAFGRHDWASLSTPDVIATVVREACGLFQRHERELGMLMSRANAEPEMARRGGESAMHLVAAYTETVGDRRSEFTHKNKAAAIDFSVRVLTDTLARRVTDAMNPLTKRQASWKRTTEDLVVLIQRYLLG
jgi:AcrR family transcriptional regulator